MLPRERVEAELATPQGLAPVAEVRDEIAASWRDCVASGLRHDCCHPPHEAEVDVESLLARAGGPVVRRLGRDLEGTGVAVVLADDGACVVDAHAADELMHHRLGRLSLAPGFAWRVEAVGTNALGLATRDRSWAIVDGREHFMDALAALTTVAAPVCDRRSGGLCGTVALVCPTGGDSGGNSMVGQLQPIYDGDTVVAALVRFRSPARRHRARAGSRSAGPA